MWAVRAACCTCSLPLSRWTVGFKYAGGVVGGCFFDADIEVFEISQQTTFHTFSDIPMAMPSTGSGLRRWEGLTWREGHDG